MELDGKGVRLAVVAWVGLGLAGGCASPATKLVPGKTAIHQRDIAMPKSRVFNGIVEVVHDEGLEIDIVNMEAGILRLEAIPLTAAQLDDACEMPLVYEETGLPATTFAAHDAKLRREGSGELVGSVEHRFLVRARDEDSTHVDLRSEFSVRGPKGSVACQSRGIYEQALFGKLDDRLLTPAK